MVDRFERWLEPVRRGDIVLVNLEPVRGSEADKRRPAVVVSNDGANIAAERSGRGVVTVAPLTSNTQRVYPFQVLLPARTSGLDRASKIQAEQIRSISVERVGARIGAISPEVVRELDEAIRLHLAL